MSYSLDDLLPNGCKEHRALAEDGLALLVEQGIATREDTPEGPRYELRGASPSVPPVLEGGNSAGGALRGEAAA